jgi:hypothetical protein
VLRPPQQAPWLGVELMRSQRPGTRAKVKVARASPCPNRRFTEAHCIAVVHLASTITTCSALIRDC